MKKRICISIALAAIFIFSSISIVFAWYTAQSRSSSFDASTGGIVFSYSLDTDYTNVTTYDVTNLAFFDISKEDEVPYFSAMVCKIQLDLTNKSNDPIQIEVRQNNLLEGTAYISCLICEDTSLDLTGASSIEGFITEKGYDSKYSISSLNAEESKTLYIYVFGVQTNPEADNEFLNDVYEFTLEVEAQRA